MQLELQSARSLEPGGRVDLFNASYEGYLVPMHVDEATVAFMVEMFDLDVTPRASRFATAPRWASATSACAARTPGSAASASFRPHGAPASARR